MKNVINALGIAVSIFVLFFAFILFAVGMDSNDITLTMIGVFFVVLSTVCCVFLIKKTKRKNSHHFSPQPILFHKEKMFRQDLVYDTVGTFKFVSGLPLRPGAKCKIVYSFDKIIISGQGVEFTISKDKILDISVQKDINVYSQMISSSGGALAGALAFGAIGAAIGGRAKVKNFKNTKKILVLTYNKENNIQYIAFEYKLNAELLINRYKQIKKNNIVKTVEL